MIANCNHDGDSQHYNIVIVTDGYYEHVELKRKQLLCQWTEQIPTFFGKFLLYMKCIFNCQRSLKIN